LQDSNQQNLPVFLASYGSLGLCYGFQKQLEDLDQGLTLYIVDFFWEPASELVFLGIFKGIFYLN